MNHSLEMRVRLRLQMLIPVGIGIYDKTLDSRL